MKLVILIPAYNEGATVASVVSELPKKVEGISIIDTLVIDDGSTDNTRAVAESAGARVVSHNRNRGVGVALATGIDVALQSGADIVVNIDADGQFDSSEIPALIAPIQRGMADMSAGNRFSGVGRPEHMPKARYWGNHMMSFLVSILIGKRFADVSCGFRAYSRDALLNMHLFGSFTYTQETFLDMGQKGLKIAAVPVSVTYFPDRDSKVANNLFHYARKTSAIILRAIVYHRSSVVFGYPAAILSIIGLYFVSFMVGHRLILGSYTPYKAFGFIGTALLSIGILLFLFMIVVNVIDRMRQVQERTLYYQKRAFYDKK